VGFYQTWRDVLSVLPSPVSPPPLTGSSRWRRTARHGSALTLIRPRKFVPLPSLSQLFSHRDLLWLLAWRDIQIRYKQTLLGASWAIIQPLVTMVVLHLFFGRLMGMQQQLPGVAYPIFLYAALLPWTFFTTSVTAAANSLIANAGIVRKVYFPRLLLPLSAFGAPMVDFVIAFIVLIAMMWWFQVAITLSMLLLLPLLIASVMFIAAGVGLLLSALAVSYRDVRHVLPFLIQIGLFVTPVIYPVTMLPARFQWMMLLNPMAGVIEMFRAAVLNQPLPWLGWAISLGVGLVMLTIGLAWFQKVERQFADVV